MNEHSPHEKSLHHVMVWGTALAFGVLGGIIASMRDFFGGDASFHFSFRTAIGFAVGAVMGFVFWWLIGRWQQSRR